MRTLHCLEAQGYLPSDTLQKTVILSYTSVTTAEHTAVFVSSWQFCVIVTSQFYNTEPEFWSFMLKSCILFC